MDKKHKLLILGGTRNARDLAISLAECENLDVITSLAGRTMEPDRTFGKTRVGGFGGAEGLASYLQQNEFDLFIDSTHPFATNISRNAAEAERLSNVPRLVLIRPMWEKQPGDNWIDCNDINEAADKLPTGSISFLALGHQYLAGFSARTDIHFIARMLNEPASDIPLVNHELVIAKPSHKADEEAALFRHHNVTNLVCRNSGGTLIYAKIEAARMLNLPIFMIKRPPPPPGKSFENIKDLAAHIIGQFS